MSGRPRSTIPESVRELGNRIEHWRESRPHRCAMPADLWDEAATLARVHGIHAVARALHLGYDSLKKHTNRRTAVKRPRDSGAQVFVELAAEAPMLSSTQADTVVELTNRAGDRLAIRLPARAQLDLGGLAAALMARRS